LKAVDLLTVEERYKLEKQVMQLSQRNKEESYLIKGQLLEKEEQIKSLSYKFDDLQSMVERLILSLASDSSKESLGKLAKSMFSSGILKPSLKIA
jgi:uncharacterized Ntn-hydrolase superfamily protein